jgi:hypothetical protein
MTGAWCDADFSSTALTKKTSTAAYSPPSFQMCAMRPFGETDKKSGCGTWNFSLLGTITSNGTNGCDARIA